MSLRARIPDSAFDSVPPWQPPTTEEVPVKRIRDKVAGLDVHRDTVVACARLVEPDRSVSVTKASFKTTSKGLAELGRLAR